MTPTKSTLLLIGALIAGAQAGVALAQEATDPFGRPLRRDPSAAPQPVPQPDRANASSRNIEWDKDSTRGWDVGSSVVRGVSRDGKHVCYLYFNGGTLQQMAMACVPNN